MKTNVTNADIIDTLKMNSNQDWRKGIIDLARDLEIIGMDEWYILMRQISDGVESPRLPDYYIRNGQQPYSFAPWDFCESRECAGCADENDKPCDEWIKNTIDELKERYPNGWSHEDSKH